jgi:hypothetical protein
LLYDDFRFRIIKTKRKYKQRKTSYHNSSL